MKYSGNGGEKGEYNLSIDHFPLARSRSVVHLCFIPILSHYALFSRCAACQAKREVASLSDHDKPAHCCSLKMIPIWASERKLAGVQMRHLGSGSARVRLALICSLQERTEMDGPDGSWLHLGEASAPRCWEVQRLVS